MGLKSDSSATANATSLGRFIMETAIEEIYYEMLNKRQINELAEWIQLDECKEVESAINSQGLTHLSMSFPTRLSTKTFLLWLMPSFFKLI